MLNSVLLVSRDPALEQRIRRVLSLHAAVALHCAPAPVPPPHAHGWLLVLADAAAGMAAAAPALGPAPLLWLADPPLAAAVPFAAGVIDCLDRNESGSKLAFVLQQHLAHAYLRRRAAAPGLTVLRNQPETERRELANLLTGILGNADLALALPARLPLPLRQRLLRIRSLSASMCDLLTAAPPVPGLAAMAPPVVHAA